MEKGSYKEITYKELLQLKNNSQYVIIDIRSRYEYQRGHIKGAISIPEYEVLNRLQQFNKKKNYIFVCQKGKNSQDVAKTLATYGFNTISLQNGLNSIK